MTRLSVGLVLLAACSGGGDPTPPTPACPAPVAGATILLNELMADNAVTAVDDTGDASDWVELYNPGTTAVNLCGYGLTTDFADPLASVLGPEVIVPPNGHVVIWLTGRGDVALPFHAAIALSRDGGELGLATPTGEWLDRVVYGPQAVDFSAARAPDGADLWNIEWHVSPGAPNPPGDGAPAGADQPGAAPEEIPAAGDLTETILSYDALPLLGIQIAPADIDALRLEPRTFVPADLIYEGRRYGPVGLRLKGSNSFLPIDEKPSLRINVDEYVAGAKFFGLDDVTLNNMSGDFSMVHERLSYYVARQVGPASRCNHAFVTINDQTYGLYANVETVKHHLLARWFDDESGPLFEATDVDFAAEYIDAYEHESGPDDRALIAAAAEALTDPVPSRAIATASEYVDMSSLFAYWGMAAVIAQFDAFPYSLPGDDYFLYADPGTNRLWFLPWGMDETFYSGDVDVQSVSSLLAKTCLAVPSCQQSFVEHTWLTMDLVEDLDLLAETDRVVAQIAPYVAMDQRKPYSDQVVAEFQEHLRWFLRDRRADLAVMLAPAEP